MKQQKEANLYTAAWGTLGEVMEPHTLQQLKQRHHVYSLIGQLMTTNLIG